MMNAVIDDLLMQINELEDELEEFEFGSVSYDYISADLQYLYLELDKLKKENVA